MIISSFLSVMTTLSTPAAFFPILLQVMNHKARIEVPPFLNGLLEPIVDKLRCWFDHYIRAIKRVFFFIILFRTTFWVCLGA